MLFSIPFFVCFSSLCLLTKQTEIKENDEEITLGHNTEQAVYVEEPILNCQSKVIYKECRKNHASSIGGYALDGCCEFSPAGVEGALEFFNCAACNCHRNFHHKVTIAREPTHCLFKNTCSPQPTPISTVFQTMNGYLHVSGPPRGATTDAFPSAVIHDGAIEGLSNSKKRFRTKFTLEQKEKMLDFAVKIGWKIHKHDQNVVEDFCNKIGVKFHVFKVWMLNNKHTIGKKH